MTKDTRRTIENRLEDIEENDSPAEVEIHSDVQVITEDMTDARGNRIPEKVPQPEPPEGYELGDVLPTQSPVVTWHELEPAEENDDGDT